MCGIAAIHKLKDILTESDYAGFEKISQHMRNRGPDDQGKWVSEDRRTAFYHRRLSILDVSERGRQPMTSKNGKYTVCYNGEIYNFKEIKADLLNKGYSFESNTDTEVLLNLYDYKQEEMLNELRGMFAFCLWDDVNKTLLLARDPYGIKPLYYAENNERICVASQVKSLLQFPEISATKNEIAKVGFLMNGSIPEPYTYYKEIMQVPSGTYLKFDSAGFRKSVVYADIYQTLLGADEDLSEFSGNRAQQYTSEKLLETVRYHFTSDVPVGIFLSSGIDSSCLVALARECGINDISTITLGFEEFKGSDDDETVSAKEFSKIYATKHHEYFLSKKEFFDELPNAIQSMDQPSIDGLNTYFVSRIAKNCGLKVALSGIGADELFGGYPSFKRVAQLMMINAYCNKIPYSVESWKWAVQSISTRVRPLKYKWLDMLSAGENPVEAYCYLRGVFSEQAIRHLFPGLEVKRLSQVLKSRIKEYISKTDYRSLVALESGNYLKNQLLRDADWSGMANSVEIRTPFVDFHLLSQMSSCMSDAWINIGKKMLANSPVKALPQSILKRKKTGFQIPMQKWLEEYLPDELSESFNGYQIHWSQKWAVWVLNNF